MRRCSGDRASLVFVHFAVALGTFACGWYVFTQAAPLPLADEWGLLREWAGRDSLAEWVWRPHNDHRFPFTKLVWIGTLQLTDFRFTAPAFLSVGLMAATATLLAWTARTIRGRARLEDVLLVGLVLHLGHGLSLLMGYQVGFALGVYGVAGWLWCASRLHTGGGWPWAALSAAYLVPVVCCGGFGLAFTPAAVVWLAFSARIEWKRGHRIAPALLAVVAAVAAGYSGWVAVSGTATARFGFDPVAEPVNFSSVAIGFLTCGAGPWPAGGGGAALGTVVVLAYLWGGGRLAVRVWKGPDRAFPLAALLVVVSTVVVGLAVARTRADALVDRYTAFASLGLAALYLSTVRPGSERLAFGVIGVILAVGLFRANFAPGLRAAIPFERAAAPLLSDLRGNVPVVVLAGRHGGAALCGDEFGPILRSLRSAEIPPFAAIPPDPPHRAVRLFSDAPDAVVWRDEAIELPNPPMSAFALRVNGTTSTGVPGHLHLCWTDADTGRTGTADAHPMPFPGRLRSIFVLTGRPSAIRLGSVGWVPNLELSEFEWLVSDE